MVGCLSQIALFFFIFFIFYFLFFLALIPGRESQPEFDVM
jgi:hypothetical protein